MMRFSVFRRSSGLIDIMVPREAGVDKVRLKTDSNPFGSFSTTVVESRHGYVDPDLAGVYHPLVQGEMVRFVLKPTNFTLPDVGAFWLKVVGVDTSNAEMVSPSPSAPTLVHPVVSGISEGGFNATAPVGAAVTDAVRIDLGRAVTQLQIRNLDAARALHVSYDAPGSETIIPFGTEAVAFNGTTTSLYLRGIGGTVAFNVRYSLAVNK